MFVFLIFRVPLFPDPDNVRCVQLLGILVSKL
jgi:hypothetical protein